MRRVVMGHQDNGAVGVRWAELGHYRGPRALRQHRAQPAASGGQVVNSSRADQAGRRAPKYAVASQDPDAGRNPRGGGEAERPPEGPVDLFGLDPRSACPELAQTRRQPFRRHSLPV